MDTVDELDGFHPNEAVKINRVYPIYEENLVGSVGTIEKIAAENKLDYRIAIRVPGQRLLVFCDSDQITHEVKEGKAHDS